MEIVEEYCPICARVHEVESYTRTIRISGVESMEEYFICPVTKDSDNEFIAVNQFIRNFRRHQRARMDAGLQPNMFSVRQKQIV